MNYKCVQRGTVLLSMIFTLFLFVFTGDFAALAQLPYYDAMAPSSSRPHPYRATSTVDTPEGPPRRAAWIAGPGCLPRRHWPTSTQTHFSSGGLLSFTGTDTSQRTWSCPIQCSCKLNFQKRQYWRTWSSFYLGTSLSTNRGRHLSISRFTHRIDHEITHPMGHSYGTLRFGIPLCWSSGRCFPSTNRLDHRSTFGRIPTWMAHPAVQLHRIYLAGPRYLTTFCIATSMP